MIKVTYFVRRLPEIPEEDFRRHWRTNHAALIAKHATTFGIGRYAQVHPVEHPANRPSTAFPDPCDGIAELWFNTRADLDLWFDNSTPAARAAGKEIRDDERTFIDRARSPALIGEEIVFVGGE